MRVYNWNECVLADTPNEFVDADIAQELYDALKIASKSLATYGEHPIIEERIQEALKNADKE